MKIIPLLAATITLLAIAGAARSSSLALPRHDDHIFTTSTWVAAPSATPKNNLFRSPAFKVPTNAKSAWVYFSCAGWCELFVSGHRARTPEGHDARMEVGTTSFAKRSLFVAYDVGTYLRHGDDESKNVLGLQIGNGWWGMKRAYNKQPYVRAELIVDGKLIIGTNSSWIAAQGPMQRNSVYFGQEYNASLEVDNWAYDTVPPTKYTCASCGPVVWSPARSVPAAEFSPRLELRKFAGERVIKRIVPTNYWYADSNKSVLVIDFGIEFAGTISVVVKGTRGSVTFHYGEILDHYEPGRERYVYFKNLRSAQDNDILHLPACNASWLPYTTYNPRFSWRGGRFAQVNISKGSDISLDFIAGNIVGEQINTAVDQIAHFNFPDLPTFGKIVTRVEGATLSNLQSYPTDCSQRDERLGWSADAYLAAQLEFPLFDMSDFTVSHLENIVDDMVNSEVPDVVPFVRYGHQKGDPAWGQVLPELLFDVYAETSDIKSILGKFFGPAYDWVVFLQKQVAATGWSAFYYYYGDWVPPPPTPAISGHFVSSFALLFQMNLLRSLCVANDNITVFEKLTTQMQSYIPAVRQAWWSEPTKQWANTSLLQSSYAFPLGIPGLFPGGSSIETNPTLDNLLSMMDTADGHFNTGVSSLRVLPIMALQHALGRPDTVIQMLTKTTYPGYAYEWSGDAETPTTYNLWEVWNAPQQGPGMDSRDHAFLSVGAKFLTEGITGFLSGISVVQGLQHHFDGKKSFSELRALHDKYAAYGTAVIDLSMPSFNTPVRSAATQRSILKNGAGKKDSNELSLSWSKSGGDFMCRHYELSTVFAQKQRQEFSCGAGSSITEIIDVLIGDPAGSSCPTLFRIDKELRAGSSPLGSNNDDDDRSFLSRDDVEFVAQHERAIAEELRQSCISSWTRKKSCDIAAAFSQRRRAQLSRVINNKTTSIYVRARCSTPARTTASVRLARPATPSLSSSAAEPPQQRFEIFVSTFGLRDPQVEIRSVGKKRSVFTVESNASNVAAHALIPIVSRGRVLQKFVASSPSSSSSPVHLITATLEACHEEDPCGLDIIVQESAAAAPAARSFATNNKKKSSLLKQIRSPLLNFGSCSNHKKILAVDRIDYGSLSAACRKIVSPSKLHSALEMECIATASSSCSLRHESAMHFGHVSAQETTLSERCASEVEQAVSLLC